MERIACVWYRWNETVTSRQYEGLVKTIQEIGKKLEFLRKHTRASSHSALRILARLSEPPCTFTCWNWARIISGSRRSRPCTLQDATIFYRGRVRSADHTNEYYSMHIKERDKTAFYESVWSFSLKYILYCKYISYTFFSHTNIYL